MSNRTPARALRSAEVGVWRWDVRTNSVWWSREARALVGLDGGDNPATLEDLDPLIDAGLERGYENFNIKVAPDTDFDLNGAISGRF